MHRTSPGKARPEPDRSRTPGEPPAGRPEISRQGVFTLTHTYAGELRAGVFHAGPGRTRAGPGRDAGPGRTRDAGRGRDPGGPTPATRAPRDGNRRTAVLRLQSPDRAGGVSRHPEPPADSAQAKLDRAKGNPRTQSAAGQTRPEPTRTGPRRNRVGLRDPTRTDPTPNFLLCEG